MWSEGQSPRGALQKIPSLHLIMGDHPMYPNDVMMWVVRCLTSSLQECLKNCQRLEKTLELWPLNALWGPGLDPGTEKGCQWKSQWNLVLYQCWYLGSIIVPWLQQMSALGEVGWRVCGNSLYFFWNSFVNLKLFQNKIVIKREESIGRKGREITRWRG